MSLNVINILHRMSKFLFKFEKVMSVLGVLLRPTKIEAIEGMHQLHSSPLGSLLPPVFLSPRLQSHGQLLQVQYGFYYAS
jgi:hypothetical protein